MKSKRFSFKDSVIFEDQDYFFLNKPPFISTLSDRSGESGLLEIARKFYPDAQVCHRLDKETSGVLAFAKHAEAYRHLNMQFEHREVTKLYHAVVEGIHQFVEKEVNKPIAKKTDGTVMIQPGGKPAQTFFSTVKAYRQHTLVACKPITGRMHQIRIHLAYLGAPIIGDIQYGAKPFYLSSIIKGYKMKKWEEEEPFLKRFGLHAAKLVFRSLSGVMLEVEAAYPPDFSALIKQLEKAS